MEAVCADRQRILVVEDMPDNLLVLQATLEHEGFEVMAASDGEEALRFLDGNAEVDLVLSDVMMPGISGYELCQKIRHDSRTAHLPVVLITAKRLGESDALQGMNTGADDYLTRPIDPRLLVRKIQLLLSRKKNLELWQAKYQKEKEQLEMQEWGTRTLVHDMRNPLTGAMAALSLLELDANVTPEQSMLIKKARTCLNRQRDMLQDILLTAAAQNGQLKLNAQPFDMASCVREQIELHREIAQRQRILINILGMAGRQHVCGDARLLSRVVANLIMNALKHGRPASTMTVWLGEPRGCPWPIAQSGKLAFAIHNEGAAIPVGYQKSIFQPFAQGPAAGEGGGDGSAGVGLGLNFCLKVVQLHDGAIDILSPVPGGDDGTVFYITLP